VTTRSNENPMIIAFSAEQNSGLPDWMRLLIGLA
jgi:hypothetical protein